MLGLYIKPSSSLEKANNLIAQSSPIGTLIEPSISIEFCSPTINFNRPDVSSGDGLVLINLIAPPILLPPYNTPCGPFKISILSKSPNREVASPKS